MQVLDASDRFFVEGGLVGSGVEVEVAAEDLVAAFAAEDHLDAHGFDFAAEEEHRGGGADGGYIVGLEVEDYV